MYRILIADDEPLITQGLKALIEREEPEIKEIAVAADGEEALEWMENGKNLPDILILCPFPIYPQTWAKRHRAGKKDPRGGLGSPSHCFKRL